MPAQSARDFGFLTEEAFVDRLHLEQRRTERSRRPFVFMLLESALLKGGQEACERILSLLAKSIRETDIRGWYKKGSAIGLIFTEIGDAAGPSIGDGLLRKVQRLLEEKLTTDEVSQVELSYYLFPEDWDKHSESCPAVLYPDSRRSRRPAHVVKRCLDVAGSMAALIIASPVFLAIALAVKLTSKGPVFYRQTRVGQYGRNFVFLKFRSMYANNDHEIHRTFVRGLITDSANSNQANSTNQKVFKLTNDPRITRVGKFLRRTSLDEIPQFFNVLLGDMSLVGPRPPIPYEVEAYDIWHRRRLLVVKPGITGLWQVNGRSRTTFDEMVRLDLKYSKTWTVWMDVKILLQTPRAVIAGDGAY